MSVRLTDSLTGSLTPPAVGRWNTDPMDTRTRQPTSWRWALPFLAALVAVLATLLSSASASAATTATAETRVRASSVVVDVLVGPPEHIAAGQRLGEAAGRVVTTVATGVAANAGPKALNAASRVSPWAGPSLSRLTREGETMYRVWGGGADKAGSWLTPINPISSAAARQGLALPAENAALYVSKVTLPAGVRIQVGTAGRAFGQPGGWAQAQLLERIPLSSFGKGVPLQ